MMNSRECLAMATQLDGLARRREAGQRRPDFTRLARGWRQLALLAAHQEASVDLQPAS